MTGELRMRYGHRVTTGRCTGMPASSRKRWMDESQEEIIGFLSNGASYGMPGASVERIVTHCSIVFLVGDRAYKLKRPVVFSSVDYSTLDRREAACRAELALNRRTAPDLYLAVRSIRRRADGAFAFDGDGPAIDWIVVMRRFDRADLLDHLAECGRLTTELVTALAGEIAKFHQHIESTTESGGAEGLRAAIDRNRADQSTVDDILGSQVIEQLHRSSIDALNRAAPLLERRRGEGRVRRCHGDLRLANICLVDDWPTLFDAVEFSDEISCVDVLYDLAFLLIDLHQRGLEMLANLLFNRYLDATGDEPGLGALPLMLSVRAGTRAYMLAGAMRRQDASDRAKHRAAAVAYITLGSSLLIGGFPRVIAVGGIGGSGKSAIVGDIAARLEPAPGARVLRGTVARKRLLGLAPDARLPASAYDAETTERAYRWLGTQAAQVVRAGYSAIIDDSFADADQRAAVAVAASATSAPFIGLWAGRAPPATEAGPEAGRWHIIETASDAARMLSPAGPSPRHP
jgi:uncharacterized protein